MHHSANSVPKVLIFDSGVGGLSVYQQIQARYPQLDYLYLFDNEAYPYGELPEPILIERVLRLMTHMVAKEAIDIVVIACNTASTVVLPHLRQALNIPVIGVVPAIKPAATLSKLAIGLIATPATVNRSYTHDLISKFSAGVDVKLLGSTRLVMMAEEKLRGTSVDLKELEEILQPLFQNIDVAVLGCTHFPLLRNEIQQVLGVNVALIDSGEAIAMRVGTVLQINPRRDNDLKQKFYPIYSSAAPWEGAALNNGLAQFGFNPVEILQFQDA
ncbi:glutamate racemase [Vibrio rumoiensis]|uniref:Glutamate racemase n=1 Tax=Vibrio rumoiensis TaxID=76258 RepID=A0ABW7IQL3_9VIBR|nr:glutamate racemase [Vibrio rumoiensis]